MKHLEQWIFDNGYQFINNETLLSFQYVHAYKDYDMVYFISYPIWAWDFPISPRAVGPRADIGVGLI